jgi:hypothetical protein
MTIPLDTATVLSPTRSTVVEACAGRGSGKNRLLILPFGLPIQAVRTL